MRRLTRSLPLCAAAIALALAALALGAQAPALDATASIHPTSAVAEAAAPLPPMLVPPATTSDEARTSTISQALVEDAAGERRRSGWKYPLIGMAVGAVVGAGFGTWVMLDTEEWLAPPAHIVTVPAGAVLGLALGGLANLLDPR